MAHVLIIYGTTEGQTRKIARRMGELMVARGHEVDVTDGTSTPPMRVVEYDAVVVAASLHRQRHQAAVEAFVKENLDALQRLPTAFFSVSLSAASEKPAARRGAQRCADQFLAGTGWRPGMVRLVAGALKYSKYPFFVRQMMRYIAWRSGGDIDTSRDYEYTNWVELRRDVVESFLPLLPAVTSGWNRAIVHALPREELTAAH